MPTIPTLTQFILTQQRLHPDATGDFTALLNAIGLAAKIISREVNRAGIVDILGGANTTNVHGEAVQKLDVFANETLVKSLSHTGLVCVMGSEEAEEPIPVDAASGHGDYVALFDPLDGSSNIDVGVSVGTIFGIYRRKTQFGPGTETDMLQPGRDLAAAGYVVYGSSTMFVYSTGHGVHQFTLDQGLGEFLLAQEALQHGTDRIYSVNESYSNRWSPGFRDWIDWMKGGAAGSFSARYIGSLVADFHRGLIKGGVFAYPADKSSPSGKLRLLYECAPLAFIAEQAGGAASNGRRRILDLTPSALHQRSPLFIGSKPLVEKAVALVANDD